MAGVRATRGYAAAQAALGTLISGKRRSDGKNWASAFEAMEAYCGCLGLGGALRTMAVVHVAGTKGKGSTCAMVESVLRTKGYSTGLFTSPHLVDVRERIRIGGKPVEEDVFLEHFWPVFDTLKEKASDDLPMPAYFRFMTLLAIRIFDRLKVDAAIFEVGLGGRLDATNVVPRPVVTAVTSLGYDHMELLGNTLGAIAGEKAGIFKKGVPAFTSDRQDPEAMASLVRRAGELDVPLYVPPPLADDVVVGLAGEHQRLNAALAVAICRTWETRRATHTTDDAHGGDAPQADLKAPLSEAYRAGLAAVRWPGRAQVEVDDPPPHGAGDDLTFYLDGAHTPESVTACAEWFAEVCESDAARAADAVAAVGAAPPPSPGAPPSRVLLFNCQEERSPAALLQPLHDCLTQSGVSFDRAFFVPPDSSTATLAKDGAPKETTAWQQALGATWHTSLGGGHANAPIPVAATRAEAAAALAAPRSASGPVSCVVPSLGEALEALRTHARGPAQQRRVQVLVTGSLYLVGDMLRLLRRL